MQIVVIEAKALPIPEQKLDPVTATTSKREHRTTCWLLPQDTLSQCRDPLPHIRDAAGQIHTNTSARPNHAASIARIRAVSVAGAIVL